MPGVVLGLLWALFHIFFTNPIEQVTMLASILWKRTLPFCRRGGKERKSDPPKVTQLSSDRAQPVTARLPSMMSKADRP